MAIRQLLPYDFKPSHWSGGEGRPIAMISLRPKALTERYGLIFEHGCDNLDYYDRAAIELTDGLHVWLVQYDRAPEEGRDTLIFVDIASDWAQTLKRVLAELELTEGHLSWVIPGVTLS